MPGNPPAEGEFEFTLFGPGYGESIVPHVGDGHWVLVDSCVNKEGVPQPLHYLQSIGVDPAESVDLIVAPHWHDDHVRGIGNLVEACSRATFCCAGALCKQEFLAVVHALEGRNLSRAGSGLREIHRVISRLVQMKSRPTMAVANRRIFLKGRCEIWALSPNDQAFQSFLQSIGRLVASGGGAGSRIPELSPNGVAVVLWVCVDDLTLLLGSDLEKSGWIDILSSGERPIARASVFKVPHHGSRGAYVPDVWEYMLDPNPIATLTPWRRGGRLIPNRRDVQCILTHTANAYATVHSNSSTRAVARNRTVARTIREAGVKLRALSMAPGAVRIRYPLGSRGQLRVETFGKACHLGDFAPR